MTTKASITKIAKRLAKASIAYAKKHSCAGKPHHHKARKGGTKRHPRYKTGPKKGQFRPKHR